MSNRTGLTIMTLLFLVCLLLSRNTVGSFSIEVHLLLIAPTGEAPNDFFGTSVGTAGDVNGDGFDDVIVGAPLNDAGGFDAGRAYVYYGGPGRDEIADLTLTGTAASDQFGISVGTAGDVNGDGFADVIVGANLNDAGGADAGRAYVYYGGPGADTMADLTLTGTAAGDNFGISVGTAGDVNGDGFDDVIVGARANDAGGIDAGQAYVYYGGPGADTMADLTLTGEAANDFFGFSVGTAGDVNGDGFADVIVGAYLTDADSLNDGRAYVYYGGSEADSVADLILSGEGENDNFGVSVGTAGDVNGDGFDDVIVGADANNAGGLHAGRAYMYYGGPGADTVVDLILTGAAVNDRFGFSVGTAGDLNGDGYTDVIVGAYRSGAGGLAAGRAYVPLSPQVIGVRDTALPVRFALDANMPNPFHFSTRIRYELPQASAVRLHLYDVRGSLVRVLQDTLVKQAGRYEVIWDARDDAGQRVSAGIYFYRLEAQGFTRVRRLILLR